MHDVQSPRTDDGAIEQEIKAKGLNAPRVTPADIEAVIASTHYFTAAEGIKGADGGFAPMPTLLLTFCVLVLKNGFSVTGESACASPENFDAEIGRKVARANAVNKIWALLGYALKERLYQAQQPAQTPVDDTMPPHQRRVINERTEIEDRLDKLSAFLVTPTFEALPEAEQERLVRQSGVMVQYSDVLAERIAAF